MSINIEIEKTLDIDVDGETVKLTKEINIQVDHVKCSECGNDMEFTLESDSYGDLQIVAEKCNCQGE